MGKLEYPEDLTHMSFGCGKKPEHQEEIHTGTGRTYLLQTETPVRRQARTQNLIDTSAVSQQY